MATASGQISGRVLDQVAQAVTRQMARCYGRGPQDARAFVNGDLLVVVLREALLPFEHRLAERGRDGLVREVRTTLEEETRHELAGEVEDLTGMHVVDYQSQVLIKAGTVVELFLLADRA